VGDAAMIEATRCRRLNDRDQRRGRYVLYWMQQSQRASFNPALEYAIEMGNRAGLPVLVAFGLMDDYPDANLRHYRFLLEGLQNVAATLAARRIRFVVLRGAPTRVAAELAQDAALLVCDRGYLRHQKAWRVEVARDAPCAVVEVEGDVVVPLGVASGRAEAAARTLRPKLHRVWEEYLRPLEDAAVQKPALDLRIESAVDLSDLEGVLGSLQLDRSVAPVARFHGGTAEARRRLRRFLAAKLDGYARARSEPAAFQCSLLSPYLHFGQISPVEVALAVRAARKAADADRGTYLEELIVRRELAANFVEFEPRYDDYTCLPAWARATLDAHSTDERLHVYTRDQLESARTHDRYWNAAMREMRDTGFMHNYMRMYWAKKVLEWSADPQSAFWTVLHLNNKYFLDGRDPNSYANVAWVFGMHDRPWPERPVFGKVRYMNAQGLERKFDMAAYLRAVDALVDAKRG
jgi:deoxyribodipyrimidine photo-lyase